MNWADGDESDDPLKAMTVSSVATMAKCCVGEQPAHPVEVCSRAEESPKTFLQTKEHGGYSWTQDVY